MLFMDQFILHTCGILHMNLFYVCNAMYIIYGFNICVILCLLFFQARNYLIYITNELCCFLFALFWISFPNALSSIPRLTSTYIWHRYMLYWKSYLGIRTDKEPLENCLYQNALILCLSFAEASSSAVSQRNSLSCLLL